MSKSTIKMCCNTQVNHRYQKLRCQLNDLGYLQPLGSDSVLLVEHLLSDYLHTSEKLKYYKETAQDCLQACHNLEISVEPYKSDNAKLVCELNSLHNQILDQKATFDKSIKDLEIQLKKVETEKNDLEELVGLQTNRIRELEKESLLKNEKLTQLQCLDLKPIITCKAGSKKRTQPFAEKKGLTRLEIDPGVTSNKNWQEFYSAINQGSEDPVVVDLVLLTEQRCQKLEKALRCVEEEKQSLYHELELCAEKVADRAAEIERLQKLLTGGRPAEAVNREFYVEDSTTVDCSSSTMNDWSSKNAIGRTHWLQQRLEEAIEKQHEAMCHAMRLADHNRMLEAQLRCCLETKCHCSSLAPQKDNCDNIGQNEDKSHESYNQKIIELTRRLDEVQAENDELKKCLDKAAEEKKKINNKVNELTIVENKLMEEISRLSRLNAAQRAKIVDLEDRKDKCKCRKTTQTNLKKASSGSIRTYDIESFKANKCKSTESTNILRASTNAALLPNNCVKSFSLDDSVCKVPNKISNPPQQSPSKKLTLKNFLLENPNGFLSASNLQEVEKTGRSSYCIKSKILEIFEKKSNECLSKRSTGEFTTKNDCFRNLLASTNEAPTDSSQFIVFRKKKSKPSSVAIKSATLNCVPQNQEKWSKCCPVKTTPKVQTKLSAMKLVSSNIGRPRSASNTKNLPSPSKSYGMTKSGKKSDKVSHKIGSKASKLMYKVNGHRRKSWADLNASECKDEGEAIDSLRYCSASETNRGDSEDNGVDKNHLAQLLEKERCRYEEQLERIIQQQAKHCAQLHPPPRSSPEKGMEQPANRDAPSAIVELLLTEKNYYQKEYFRLLEQLAKGQKDNDLLMKTVADQASEKIQSEFIKSSNGTFTDLVTKLNEKEKEIANLQNTIKNLTSTDGGGDYADKYVTLIKALELERDLAKRDVKRLEEEKNSLMDKLSNMKDTQRLSESRISQLSLDFEERLRKLDSERGNLLSKQTSFNVVVENLEREIEQYRKHLVQSQAELSEQKSLYSHLKIAHEQTERALRESQNNVNHLNKELSGNLDKVQALENEVASLGRELQDLKIDRNTLRNSIKQLDQQKDFLSCKLDDKTERVALMEKEIVRHENVIRQYESTIADLHAKYNLAINENSKTEESVRRAHNEVENLHKQIKELEKSRDNLLSENKRVMNDLTTVTSEYSIMSAELERSKKEVRDLKHQLQLYVDSVKRLEDELARRDQEQSEMLEQFRNLSEESAVLEQTNLRIENEVKLTHSSLREAENKVDELQKFIEEKERKIKKYHDEMNEMRFQISRLELETSSLRDERARMENDFYASQDLSSIITSKNDHLTEQMSALNTHKVAMEAEIAVLKESLDDVSKKYRESNRDMHNVHKQISNYENELANEVQVNEKLKREVAMLNEQLNALQTQLRSKSTELERVERESADYNQELSQLRREIVNCKYEQTKAEEARSYSHTL